MTKSTVHPDQVRFYAEPRLLGVISFYFHRSIGEFALEDPAWFLDSRVRTVLDGRWSISHVKVSDDRSISNFRTGSGTAGKSQSISGVHGQTPYNVVT